MGDREDLEKLRKQKRLAELEAKASQGAPVVEESDIDWLDKIAGQIEPTVTASTGMASSAVGGIAGVGQMMLNRSGPNFNEPVRRPPEDIVSAYQQAGTYQPRTETGGDLLQAMSRDWENYVEKPIISKARFGDETLEATGSPGLATVMEILPEVAGTALGIRGVTKPPKVPYKINNKTGELVTAMDNKTNVKNQLLSGKPTEKTLGYRMQEGKIVKDALQKKAVNKGWSPKVASWAANQTKSTRTKLRDMLDTAEEYFTNMEAEARPTDHIGKTASEQAAFVNGVRSRAGRVMNNIANSDLVKKQIYIAKLRSEFHLAIRGLRGKIDKDGKLTFDPKSKISSNAGDMKALQNMQDKLMAYGSKPTGQELHEFKQWLQGEIDFNRSPVAKTKVDGLSSAVEKIFDSARVEANAMLRKSSAPYAKANDIYSETKTALDTLQKGAGNIDMFGEGAETALGTTMNRLLGNAQSRQSVAAGLNKVQDAAIKYKGPFEKQNYAAQTRFVDEMENLWGPFTESSFRAQSGDAAARVLQNPSAAQAGREAIDMTAKQIKKMTQSRAKQLESLRALLYEGGN